MLGKKKAARHRTTYFNTRAVAPPCNFTAASVGLQLAYCHTQRTFSTNSSGDFADLGGTKTRHTVHGALSGLTDRCERACNGIPSCVGFDVSVTSSSAARAANTKRWSMRAEGDTTLCTLDNITAALPKGSTALAQYLIRVYGPPSSAEAARAREREFEWGQVELIWESRLPRALRSGCRWPCDPSGFGSVFRVQGSAAVVPGGSLWVYRRNSFTSSSGLQASSARAMADSRLQRFDLGSPERISRLSPHVQTTPDAGWHEISHRLRSSEEHGTAAAALAFARFHNRTTVFAQKCTGAHSCFNQDTHTVLWMYSAVGSGLYYPMGRTVVGRRTRDIVEAFCRTLHLHVSARSTHEGDCQSTRRDGVIARRGDRPFAFRMARDLGYDTVVFTDTEEWSSNGFKVEVVGLNPRTRASYPPAETLQVQVPAELNVPSWSLGVDRATRCPLRFPALAWGWKGQRKPCVCDTSLGHVSCLTHPAHPPTAPAPSPTRGARARRSVSATSTKATADSSHACAFLMHGDTQSTPLHERVAFLRGKGVSEAAVNEAVARCAAGASASHGGAHSRGRGSHVARRGAPRASMATDDRR